MKVKKLGIIAGSGTMPQEAVREASRQNIDFTVFSLREENVEELYSSDGKLIKPVTISLGKFDKTLKEIKSLNITHVLISGKIHKEKMVSGIKFNFKTLNLLRKLENLSDKSIFNLVADEFQKAGIEVLRQDRFFNSLFVSPGIYSVKKPSKKDMENINFGMGLAKKIATLDIGQSVILSDNLLISVEAIEGTNQAIIRSGKYIKPGRGIVCKAMQKNQDTRFDVASVGPATLESMKTAGCRILAIEANRTFILEKEIFMKNINRNKMIFVAV